MAKKGAALTGGRSVESLGHIEKIVLENFKSYAGRHEIGPFDKFTCIIGPNGSGKSNVMDAISFCLGIRAKHLRGDKLRDLVYRREEEDVESNTRSARVTIVFRGAKGEEIHIGRQINQRGEGAYRYGINGHVRNVGFDDFVGYLAEQNIFIKARNFLVFQGDVMELARRQGTDLTGMLETISGSDQCKEEYDRLAKELDVTQEKVRMHFQHRREVEGAVALLEKQRAEVERYQELRMKKETLALEMVLFKLYTAEREGERNYDEGDAMKSELARSEAEFRAKRKEADETDAQRKKAEVEADKAQSQHFVLSSNLEQLKPEISQCRKQAAHWRRKVEEKEVQLKEEEERRASWEAAAKQAAEDRAKAEAEIARLKSKHVASLLELTEEQRQEFEKAVAKTDALNSKTRDKIRETEELLTSNCRELEADRRDLRELEDRISTDATKLQDIGHDKTNLQFELESEVTILEQKKKQVDIVEEELKKFTMFRDSLLEEQRVVQFKLDSAKARYERLDQVEVKQRVADELRGAFPDGVIGRLSELVMPTQKRFDFPLQMALGNMSDAFIVASAAVGRDCVKYLKEKKISTETFLPLDRMPTSDSGPMHLLTHGQRARRLATACCQYNEKFLERHGRWQSSGPAHIDRTLAFLLSNTIIVDDLEEAKAAAYRDARKHKLMPRVVTLEGEVIAPNGNMSVQSLSTMGRVEFGAAEQLHDMKVQEDKLAQVERDLATLSEDLTRRQKRAAELKDGMREVEQHHRTGAERLKSMEAAQAREQQTNKRKKERIDELKIKVGTKHKKVTELEREKETLEGELLKVGKKFFTKLNKELGVADVRELVQKETREKRKMRLEMEQFEDMVRTLVNEERSFVQKMKAVSKLEALQRDLDQYKRDVQAAMEREVELQAKESVLAERCEAGRIRMREMVIAKEELDKQTRAKRTEQQQLRQIIEDIKRRLKKHNEKIRVLLTITCAIYRECNEKLIELPFTKKDDLAMEQVVSREQDLDDLPFEHLEAACRKIEVDYSKLPESRKEAAEQCRVGDSKTAEMEYEAQIAEAAKEMEGLNPNMHAPEQYAAEAKKLMEIRALADGASKQGHTLARQFEAAKNERVARFMRCFKHVEAMVHPFYKELTSYDGYDGGSAYLDLDDAEEPYNGGITFTACPPGKRFFPMELLSGGEKSMASMALLFAMHSYQPPPFMILDEVDAPFDHKNTTSLVTYLRKLHFQCLVISLKDAFFSHSDSIVGIYKDKGAQSSGSLSLPLRRLGEQSEAPETERPLAEAILDVD